MVNGAIRFNKDVYVAITLDEENGDNEVTLILQHPDYGKMVLTGSVAWED